MEKQLLRALNDRQVRFAVVGGHAVLCYSPLERPNGIRAPRDLDILVDAEYENLTRISAALGALRINVSAEVLNAAFIQGKLPNLGDMAQLFARIPGVESEAVLRSVVMMHSSVGKVPVISKALLIDSKRSCDRPKDVEDLQALVAANESS